MDLQGKEGQPGSCARAFVPGVLRERLKTPCCRVGMLRLAGAPANTAIIRATARATFVTDGNGEQRHRTEPEQDPDYE